MKQTISVLDVHRQDIHLQHLKYIEGDGNYCVLHLTNRNPILLSRTVLRMEEELTDFIRIHKRYLVNPDFILRGHFVSRKDLTMQLSTGEVLCVSRRRLAQILADMSDFSSSMRGQ